MKYTTKNKPLVCTMDRSAWYQEMKSFTSIPVGILWHDTGAGNPDLKRYVQPSSADKNRDSLISKLGVNGNGNDWNRSSAAAGVNAFIGKLANGSVTTVQVGPWTMPPYGCGSGSKGSCNGYIGKYNWQGVHWIQFEICDDFYESKDYFNKVYKEAVELTAYLCKLYNIDPNGTVKFNGVTVPTILCHADSYDLGLGSGHADVRLWFKKYGKTMKNVRADVTKLIKESEAEVFKKGETSLGIESIKSTLNIGKLLGIFSKAMAKDGGYGSGVATNVKEAQKKAGLAQKDEIDDATVKAIWTQVETAVNSKLTELKTTKASLTAKEKEVIAKQKEIDTLNKKVKEIQDKLDKAIEVTGDANGDGVLNMKDILAIRKKLSKM